MPSGNHSIKGHVETRRLPRPPGVPNPFGFHLEVATLALHLHTMSEHIKSTLANLFQKVHSLQSSSYYRLNLPNIQLPTTSFQSKSNLPTRNLRAFITFAFLLFLLFWKDIIRDVYSHIATRRLPVPVVEVSPIRNNTLGVIIILEEIITAVDR